LHVNNARANHFHHHFSPAALRWPLYFKTKDGLALVVMLFNERQIFKDEVCKMWPGHEHVVNIANFFLKSTSIGDQGDGSIPTCQQEVRHSSLAPSIGLSQYTNAINVGCSEHPMSSRFGTEP
jgi:hypothetical protein